MCLQCTCLPAQGRVSICVINRETSQGFHCISVLFNTLKLVHAKLDLFKIAIFNTHN